MRGDRAHATHVLVRIDPRRRRVEARELVELPKSATEHEAVVGVEVLRVRIVGADHVGKREGVVGEAEAGDARRRGPRLPPDRRVSACRGEQGQRDHRDLAHGFSP